MKEKVGQVFSIAAENAPVPGCTVSKQIAENPAVTYFSLAKGTDISAEIYGYHKLILVCSGSIEVYFEKTVLALEEGAGIQTRFIQKF